MTKLIFLISSFIFEPSIGSALRYVVPIEDPEIEETDLNERPLAVAMAVPVADVPVPVAQPAALVPNNHDLIALYYRLHEPLHCASPPMLLASLGYFVIFAFIVSMIVRGTCFVEYYLFFFVSTSHIS